METGKTGSSEHFSRSGKYFKYAIGEIILVVIGILIALSINNWNEGRKAEKALHQYLSTIKVNLENDLVVLDSLKTIRITYTGYAKKEHLAFLNKTFDFNSTLSAMTSFIEFYFEPNVSGLEALKNSPYLGEINGKPIHQLIIKYERVLNAIAQYEKSLNEYIENLEVVLASKSDRTMLYGFFFLSEAEKEKVNLKDEDMYNKLKSYQEFIEYRNVVLQVSIQDQIVIPQYDALKEISLEVMNEIDKFIEK